eukprot:454839-Hanusia_phi.AAC.4
MLGKGGKEGGGGRVKWKDAGRVERHKMQEKKDRDRAGGLEADVELTSGGLEHVPRGPKIE